MTWEKSAYAKNFKLESERFAKETADYMTFMENRHKVVTLDYIATIEHENKMLKSEIEHLKKRLSESKGGKS